MNLRSELPTAENSTNFNVVSGSTTEVGTTLDNLKAAVTGETGASAEDPEWAKPVADAPVVEACDLNLIAAANGEIYETSDMYPAFIKKAQEEGNDKAVRVFTRAKLAESVHAERYMEAYNNIDAADDDAYFLCPVCGYIEKGDDFEVCPICGAKKSAFKQF